MLACYLTWHLRRAWAPLTYTDEHPPAQDNPRRPGPPLRRCSGQGPCQHDAAGRHYRSLRGLIEHLATLPRNQVRFTGAPADVPMLTSPLAAQLAGVSVVRHGAAGGAGEGWVCAVPSLAASPS
jgi:hypothetical protein